MNSIYTAGQIPDWLSNGLETRGVHGSFMFLNGRVFKRPHFDKEPSYGQVVWYWLGTTGYPSTIRVQVLPLDSDYSKHAGSEPPKGYRDWKVEWCEPVPYEIGDRVQSFVEWYEAKGQPITGYVTLINPAGMEIEWNDIGRRFNSWDGPVIASLAQQPCGVCGRPVEQGDYLCFDCRNGLDRRLDDAYRSQQG